MVRWQGPLIDLLHHHLMHHQHNLPDGPNLTSDKGRLTLTPLPPLPSGMIWLPFNLRR